MAKKAKVVKAKVVKSPKANVVTRVSKGAEFPWQVHAIGSQGHHCHFCQFELRSNAELYIKRHLQLIAPVIVKVDIPPMEY